MTLTEERTDELKRLMLHHIAFCDDYPDCKTCKGIIRCYPLDDEPVTRPEGE